MPRKQGKAVSESNGPVSQHNESGSDQLALTDMYRLFEEIFDRQLKLTESHFDPQDEI